VYNLAAQSFVGNSWDQATYTTMVNSLGVLYLLNSLKHYSSNSKFYQASTSEMFGNNYVDEGQDEETHFHPCSPYATSKLYSYWITRNYRDSFGMFCSNGILFNHESPIRGIEFVTRKISDGIARIHLGLSDKIKLGYLDSKRDWGFAGDFVEAMWLMLQQDEPDDYVVATGVNHSIRDFLDIAFNHVGISSWENYVAIDPRFKRPKDVKCLKGNFDKAKSKLDWAPKTNFEQLVKMMVDEDIRRLKLKPNSTR
jgi:GDPmannose 4,6-dehydratase